MTEMIVESSVGEIKMILLKMVISVFLAVLLVLVVVISSFCDNAKSSPQSKMSTLVDNVHIYWKHKTKFFSIANLSYDPRILFSSQVSPGNKINMGIIKVAVTLFGIDNTTGNVITFVTVKNLTKAVVSNATSLDLNNSKADGTAVVLFTFPSKSIKYDSEIKACNLTLKDLNVVCAKTEKSPVTRTVFMQLFLNYDK